jgi:hypothetical protein
MTRENHNATKSDPNFRAFGVVSTFRKIRDDARSGPTNSSHVLRCIFAFISIFLRSQTQLVRSRQSQTISRCLCRNTGRADAHLLITLRTYAFARPTNKDGKERSKSV